MSRQLFMFGKQNCTIFTSFLTPIHGMGRQPRALFPRALQSSSYSWSILTLRNHTLIKTRNFPVKRLNLLYSYTIINWSSSNRQREKRTWIQKTSSYRRALPVIFSCQYILLYLFWKVHQSRLTVLSHACTCTHHMCIRSLY